MIPDVAPGNTMDDVVKAVFDYSKLDQPDPPVRIRLLSTVVRVKHDKDPRTAKHVNITYVRDGRAYRQGKYFNPEFQNRAMEGPAGRYAV